MKFKDDIEMLKFMEDNFYSGVLSDIIDEKGYTECAVSPHSKIRPLFPEATCAGRVTTALYSPSRTGKDDPYKLLIEWMDKMVTGQVAVITSTRAIEPAIMGELTATAMIARGVRGSLVDGYTRDYKKMVEFKFPVFTKGFSPIDSTDRTEITEYDIPVIFGGKQVHPGQIAFADIDGIVFIPIEVESEVIQEAVERVNLESELRKELKEGKKVRDMWEKYHIM